MADDWCALNKPFRPTLATIAVMSDMEVTDMLEHNTYGARRCGWSK